MTTLSSSIFYILTGWTCAINIYKFFYQKKLKDFSHIADQQNDSQLNQMKSLNFDYFKKRQINIYKFFYQKKLKDFSQIALISKMKVNLIK